MSRSNKQMVFNSCAMECANILYIAISFIRRMFKLLQYRSVICLFTFLCDLAYDFLFIHTFCCWAFNAFCFTRNDAIFGESEEHSKDGLLSTCMQMYNSIKCGSSFCSAIVHALIGKQIIIYTCIGWRRVLRLTEDDWWFNMDSTRNEFSFLLLSFHFIPFHSA